MLLLLGVLHGMLLRRNVEVGVGPEQHDQPQSTDSAFVPDGSVEAVHVGNDQLAPLQVHAQVLAFTQHIHDETLGAWVE